MTRLGSQSTGVIVGALAAVGMLALAGPAVIWLDGRGPESAGLSAPSNSPGGASPRPIELPSTRDTEPASASSRSPGEGIVVQPAGSTSHRFDVSSTRLDVTSRWTAGAVVLSFTAPTGRVIDRDTVATDVAHEVGPTV